MSRQLLETEQKALEINLNDTIYGSFAEIGAGQEVARHFFQVGAAAGTIAKTISAYDKVMSDKIYGIQSTGRYVCEARVYKMLDHEFDLMETRLDNDRPNTCFFAFADSVAAINFSRTIKGNGWMGIRFQLEPDAPPNDLVIHVKMLDKNNQLQQQAIGILGVNMVYACYNYHEQPEVLLESLIDSLRGRIKIDMVRLTGPDFEEVDNRLLSLMLVKHKLTEVAMFNEEGRNVHASEFLYKKNLMIIRGSFRPATLVNMDMIKSGYKKFREDTAVDASKCFLSTEITMDNLLTDGDLDTKDFLDRADILCELGQTVIISDCTKQQKLIDYFKDYKIQQMGLVTGVRELLEMINNTFYQNQDGALLSAFGEVFSRNVKFYVYPALQEGSGELINCQNLPVPEGITFVYKHLVESGQIVDISNFNEGVLHIFSKQVLEMIKEDEKGWEKLVPSKVARLIREKCLFGFPYEQMEFEY
ncbi:MAG: TonB-dependent receptor [Bacteroidota bacterium]